MSRLFLPARTNYCTNPSLRGGDTGGLATGWSEYHNTSAAGTFAIVAGRTDAYAQRFSYTGASDTNKVNQLYFSTGAASFAAGETVTLSAYIKGTIGAGLNGFLQVQAMSAGGGSLGIATVPLATSADWTRVSVTYTNLPATTDHLQVNIVFSGIDTGDSFDITVDDVLLEKSPFPTPYFDGDSSDSLNANTYAWTGAPNASRSTRAASRLILPYSMTSAGTVALRLVPSWAGNDGLPHEMFALNTATSGWVACVKNGGNSFGMAYNDNVNTSAITGAGVSFAAGTTHSVIARFTPGPGGTLDLMHDGTAIAQAVNARGAMPWAYIGFNGNDSQNTSAYEGPIVVSSQRKSDAWTVAMDALLRSDNVDLARIKREFMAPGDALFTGRQVDGSKLFVKGA